jgi:hypothetical protein
MGTPEIVTTARGRIDRANAAELDQILLWLRLRPRELSPAENISLIAAALRRQGRREGNR